jgi:hypothetical protein
MDQLRPDAADTLSRRISLGTLGLTVALAALVKPELAFAAKSNKKARKKAKKLKTRKCRQQEAPCRAFWAGLCQDDPECGALIDCCSSFSSCNTEAALACLFPPPDTEPVR